MMYPVARVGQKGERDRGDDMSKRDDDVVVLGSGLAGSLTAMILAKEGHRVAMVEKGSHPRMAIGESLLPASAMWFWILGQKYHIPEITTLSHIDSIARNVAPTCGIKRGVGYIYHREDEHQVRPEETSMFIGATQPLVKESQFYRQDIDHYLVKAAVGYGVDYRDNTTVTNVEFGPDGVTVEIEDGEPISARLVVDATGRSSVVANQLGLREEPSRLGHQSRTIFSHLRGVAPFEDVAPESLTKRRSASWSHGTLHHVFDGGWFWVIPFDNYDPSINDLCSVGVTVSTDRHPKPDGVTPEEEFWEFVQRYPVIERHLGDTTPVRDFIGTDRLQYSSTTSVADRCILLQHSYGFIDPLFSRGIWRSIETVDAVCRTLLEALADDDLTAARFEGIDRMQADMLDDNDRMVRNAYRSMSSYETWTSWLRIWFVDELLTTLPVLATMFNYATTGDRPVLDRVGGHRQSRTGYSFSPQLTRLMDEIESLLDRAEAGEISPGQVLDETIRHLADADYLPPNIIDWESHHDFSIDLTPPTLAKLLWWSRTKAPKVVNEELLDFSIPRLLRLQIQDAIRPSSLTRDSAGNVINQVGATA